MTKQASTECKRKCVSNGCNRSKVYSEKKKDNEFIDPRKELQKANLKQAS